MYTFLLGLPLSQLHSLRSAEMAVEKRQTEQLRFLGSSITFINKKKRRRRNLDTMQIKNFNPNILNEKYLLIKKI